MEAATEDNVDGDTEKDRKRKEPVHDQGNVCGRAVHWSSPGLLESDEGGGEDGAAGAATRPGGGEEGGRYTVSLVTLFCPIFFRSVLISLWLSFFPFPLSLFLLFESLFFCLSLFLSLSLSSGQAGRGQGESPRAAGGLLEGAADGERERTVYNIVMIQ